MVCSSVGYEVWVFAIAAAGLFVLLVVTPRPLQRWIRERRPRSTGLMIIPDWCFNVWALRAIGIIPAVMLVVAAMGLHCFFHGPDLASAPVARHDSTSDWATGIGLPGTARRGSSLRMLGNTSGSSGLETTFVVTPSFPITADFVLVCLESGTDRFQFTNGAFVERGGAAVDLTATVELEDGNSVDLAAPYGIGGGGALAFCKSEIGLRRQRVAKVTLRLSRPVSDVQITLRSLSPP